MSEEHNVVPMHGVTFQLQGVGNTESKKQEFKDDESVVQEYVHKILYNIKSIIRPEQVYFSSMGINTRYAVALIFIV
jgi:hypothetical protein